MTEKVGINLGINEMDRARLEQLRRALNSLRQCPRCGEPGGWVEYRIINGHAYYYWVHSTRRNGKREIKRCYLGPDAYTYVAQVKATNIHGLISEDLNEVLNHLRAILSRITRTIGTEGGEETVMEIVRELERLRREITSEIETTINQLMTKPT